MRVLIAGAGIGGLTAALSLHGAGFRDVALLEACRRIEPVGAGLNLQPAAVRALFELGLEQSLADSAVATRALEYHHRYGGLIWSEPRGLDAGYLWPQLSIHRGALQHLLLDAVRDRLGPDALRTGAPVRRIEDGPGGVAVFGPDDALLAEGDVLIGADGIDGAVRGALRPGEGPPLSNGIAMWRGLSRWPAYGDGRTMLVVGCNTTVKLVLYPLTPPDADGLCTLNWVVESHTPPHEIPAAPAPADVTRLLDGWRHADVDLHGVIEACQRVHYFPMTDRDPLPSFTGARTALIGDAAHPMYPTGSNGASQAVLDARVLAHHLARHPAAEALARYDRVRRPETAALLAAHRRLEPDETLYRVEQLAPQGFADIVDVLAAEELHALRGTARRVGGVTADGLNALASWSATAAAAG